MSSANDSGKKFEAIVRAILSAARVHFVQNYATGYLDHQGVQIWADFFVTPNAWTNGFYIECKYQDSTGSIQQKLPMVKDRAAMLNLPLLVVAGGSKEWIAIEYFEQQISQYSARNLMPPVNLGGLATLLIAEGEVEPLKKPDHDAAQMFLL